MKAYSLDLRTRMFNYSIIHTVRATAAVFRVSPNTVQNLRQLFFETGQLQPRPTGPARPRAVSAEGELFLQALLRQEVDLTLEQLRQRYADVYGVTVSLGAMHNTLKRLDITRKKVHLRPKTEHGGRASRNRTLSPASRPPSPRLAALPR